MANDPSVTKTIQWSHFSAQQPLDPLTLLSNTLRHSLTVTLSVWNRIPLLPRASNNEKQFWTMFSFSLLLAVQKAFLHVTRSAAKFIYLPPACVPIDSPIKNASDESNNLMRQDEERQARERMNLNSTCNTPSLPFPGKLTLSQPLLFSQSGGRLSWKWGFWSQLVAHYWGSETTTATESNPWAKRRTFAA